jgi:hypothetical protein
MNLTPHARDWVRTIRAIGGFWQGDFTITGETMQRPRIVEFYKTGIGRRVVERVGSQITWEGEIVFMRLTLGGISYERSLDAERWRNRVKVQWGGGETAWGEESNSTALYGDAEYIEQASAVYDSAAAETRRDRILALDAFPRSHPSGTLTTEQNNDQGDSLYVLCAGYVFSMNRRYRETNIAAANISTQISTLVGNSEFVTAGRIDTNSDQAAVIVAGTPMRLWDVIRELIEMGDSAGDEWIGGVWANREFRYYQAQTALTHFWSAGRLIDRGNVVMRPALIKPDIVVQVAEAPVLHNPPGGTDLDNPRNVYIQEVEFRAPDQFTLIPRQPEPTPETLNELTRRVIGFADKYAAFRHAVSAFSNLTGLRGLWTMAAYDGSGNAEDHTNGDLQLTRNGDPTYGYDGLVPYVALDGTGDYFNRADEAATSITTTDGYSSAPGLTLGAWIYGSDPDSSQMVLAKITNAPSYSYYLAYRGDVAVDPMEFLISDDGTNTDVVRSSAYASTNWHFVVARFCDADTGAELAIFVDGQKNTASTARASIFDGAQQFCLGGYEGGNDLFNGRISLAFLCAAALPDDMIGALFQQSRALYGV